jgi:hypothetical protein
MSDLHILEEIRAGLSDKEAVEDRPGPPAPLPALVDLVARRLRLAAEAREASRLLARTRRKVDQYELAQAATDDELVAVLAEDMGLAQRIDPETGRAPAVVVEGVVVVLCGKAGARPEELKVEVLGVHNFGPGASPSNPL